MDAAGQLQIAATVVLNGAFCWLAGAVCSVHWLRAPAADWRHATALALWRSMSWAALACLAGAFTALVCAVALMGDAGLGEALGMLPRMLHETAYGRAALAGLVSMSLLVIVGRTGLRSLVLPGVLLLVFAWSRASISHAGEHGWFSAGAVVECSHLLLVGVWAGVVAVAGWVVLPAAGAQGAAMRPYLSSVSRAATLALAGIVASGLYNTWQRIETPGQLLTHPYGIALAVKLVLFGIAASLGAWNRFYGFPAAPRKPQGAIAVLRLESLVLLGVLLAAAMLTLQEPAR